MTKFILATPFFDGSVWHRGVGEVFDASKVSDQTFEKLKSKGYLVTEQAYRTKVNPEAAQAQATADEAQARLQELFALFPGVTTFTGLKVAVEDLQARVPSTEDLEKVSSARAFVGRLRELFPEAVAPDDLLKEIGALRAEGETLRANLKAAQANPVSPEDAQALNEYRAVVGELLPAKLTPQARKTLIEHGFVGKALVSRLSDSALLDLPNVAQATLDALRDWAPAVADKE